MSAHLLEPGWRESFRPVNGVTLHVVEAGPEDGPLLILLHGFPEFWWGWRHVIAPLAASGHRVVVPDMRGYNKSSVPEGVAAYHLDVLAEDVIGLADSFGAARFSLAGHDWGGVVAWWVGSTRAERLDRLIVLNAPHPDILGRQALRHPTQALRSSYVAFFQIPAVPEAVLRGFDFAAMRSALRRSARPGTFTPDKLDIYAEAWARPGALTAMLNYYRALRLPRRRAPRVRVPTVLIWGVKDVALGEHIAEANMELCDDGRLVRVPEASHWVQLEEPERVVAEMAGFRLKTRALEKRGTDYGSFTSILIRSAFWPEIFTASTPSL